MRVVLREGVDQHERAHHLRPFRVEYQRDGPAHRVAHDVRFLDACSIKLRFQVARASRHVPAAVERRETESAMIERDAGVAVLERGDLVTPLIREAAQEVYEDDGRSLAF